MSRRDRVVDAGCVALASLVAALFLAGNGDLVQPATGPYLVVSVVLTAAGCAALWWRRRRPLWVGAAAVAVSSVTEFAAGAALVGMVTVAVRCRPRVTYGLLLAACVAAVPYSVLRPDPEFEAQGADAVGLAAIGMVFTFVLLLPFALWGTWLRGRRRRLTALRERAARAEAEAARTAERVRRQEREHIAREMHDVLAHRITLLSLHAGALQVRPDMGAAQVAEVAGTIRATAHQALEDLREILGVLRADPAGAAGDEVAVRPQPGVADIAGLVAECRAAGGRVSLECELDETDAATLPASVSRTAYRVVQEGLTNARKHAPGHPVRVRVGRERPDGGALHVAVRNALPPGGASAASAAPGSRSGLVGLAERVSLAGGRLDHGVRRGSDGAGVDFLLEAWLPWPT